MKARQISKVIGEKVAELAKAHPEISGVLLKNSIVTGGCIASMLLKEKVNDFDIYFDDLNSMLDVIQYFGMKTGAEYLVAFQANKPLPKDGRIRPLYANHRNYETDEELTVTLPTSNALAGYTEATSTYVQSIQVGGAGVITISNASPAQCISGNAEPLVWCLPFMLPASSAPC